jgi:hypothetical protein
MAILIQNNAMEQRRERERESEREREREREDEDFGSSKLRWEENRYREKEAVKGNCEFFALLVRKYLEARGKLASLCCLWLLALTS